MPTLVERVLLADPRLRKRVLLRSASVPKHGIVSPRIPDFPYRDVIKVSALAELIALNDPDFTGTWVKTITRWLAKERPRAPQPQTIRRALTALGFDWVVGLGLSGYKQHAIAMLHALYRNGTYPLPAIQANAIFHGPAYIQDAIVWRSARSFRTRKRHVLPEESRLDEAARRCWLGSDVYGIPTKPPMPPDLSTSQELYAAWCILETALNGKAGTLEGRMAGAEETASSYVLSWVNDIANTLDPDPPSKQPSATKRRP